MSKVKAAGASAPRALPSTLTLGSFDITPLFLQALYSYP